MKNLVIIDIDTERQEKILIKKPSSIEKPSDDLSAKEMVVNDMSCVFEAFCTLMNLISDNKFGDKNQIIDIAVKHLETLKDN
jgi:hypothetical protein